MDDASTSTHQHSAGPVVLRQGFRPFFLAAGLWSALSIGVWLAQIHWGLVVPSVFYPEAWHAHEMLFGYAVAAVAGFLLTAVPNWTGRPPVSGALLALLVALWTIGRVGMASSALISTAFAAAADVAFLVALWIIVLREILAGGNRRNLPVAGLVGVLAFGNLLIHLEYLDFAETAGLGLRLSIAVILLLITLIGGRIVPSFTRNWLKSRGEQVLPSPFGRLDRVTLVVSALAGVSWSFAPEAAVTGIALVCAGAFNGLRLARWRGQRTLGEPLVWVLHLGYAWLAAGLLLLALSVLWPALPPSAALHALTSGAVGTMTLAVMTRATLGHTGRPLSAGPSTAAIYLLASGAGVLRVVSALSGSAELAVLTLSGVLWVLAFALFVAVYGPLLIGRSGQTG